MIFAEQATSIRVPEVYAVYRSENNSMLYIAMECVTGNTLFSRWPSLAEPEKIIIMGELKRQLDALRRLPSPGYYGGVGGQHMPNGIFWSSGDEDGEDADAVSITGSFKTEAALNEAFALKSAQIAEYSGRKAHRGDFYRRMLPRVLKDHPAVFTHGNFQRKNILIGRRRPGSPPLKNNRSLLPADCPDGGFEVVLVDWEYCAASWAFWFDDDWPAMVELALEPYPVEYAWLSAIVQELWS